MSNYTKTTDFAAKDSLPTGNASKRVRGSEVDAEFEAIETAVATKLDQYSSASAQTALDDDADVVSIYDDSAGSYKKITVANLKNTFIQFASGTYTGDGSTSQAITGVGFAPKYVKIVNRETVNASTVGVFETWADPQEHASNRNLSQRHPDTEGIGLLSPASMQRSFNRGCTGRD